MAYEQAAHRYFDLGWSPLPLTGKQMAVSGYTGQEGADPDRSKVNEWARDYAGSNIAVRIPRGVVGIDVDAYQKGDRTKVGDITLRNKIEEWGELPPTYTSTSRGPGQASRIYFYRLQFPARLASGIPRDIDVIQHHHRYVVVSPSVHPDTGAGYHWYGPDGNLTLQPPTPASLPLLPDRWFRGLLEGATEAAPELASAGEGAQLLAAIEADDDEPCAHLQPFVDYVVEAVEESDAGSRHDLVTGRVMSLIIQAANGHTGGGTALEAIREAWNLATDGEGRSGEFDRMVTSAARRTVTIIGQSTPLEHGEATDGSICSIQRMFDHGRDAEAEATLTALPSTAPEPSSPLDALMAGFGFGDGDAPGEAPEEENPQSTTETAPVPTSRTYLDDLLGALGTEPFAPASATDVDIADAAAKRLEPYLRRLSTGTWLERGAEKWTETDIAAVRRVLSRMGKLVPRGEDYTAVRKKLSSRKDLSSVAGMIDDEATGHGSWLHLSVEDSLGDPYLIWSGGRCIDIRKSTEKLVEGKELEGVVNTATTRYVADLDCPTPLWDDLTKAVWPDQEVREFALNVLSVAFTGEAAAVLPVLHGPGGSGKTSVAETLSYVLGDYGHTLDSSVLHGDSNKHGTFLYALKGKRLAYVDEGPAEDKVGVERLKSLTGGSTIQANKMRTDTEVFTPSHTMVMTTNNEPNLQDPAMVRRVRLLPCYSPEVYVKPVRAAMGTFSDPKAPIHAEGPGILAQMILRASRFLADRSIVDMENAPASVQEVSSSIAESQDVVGQFLAECTEPVAPGSKGVGADDLYRIYVGWEEYRKSNPRAVLSRKRFGSKVVEHGIIRKRYTTGNYYLVDKQQSANIYG